MRRTDVQHSHGRILRRLALRAARRYTVGPGLDDALAAHRQLVECGAETTLAYWNAASETVAEVVTAYCQTLEAVERQGGQTYLSVKPWAFGFDAGAFAEVLAQARRCEVPLHFDSLEWQWAERSLALVEDAGGGSDIGITVPARWDRSLGDAVRAAELGMAVRVVKGQRPQPRGEPARLSERYLYLVKRLARPAPELRIATHDARLASLALDAAGERARLELLYGLPMRRVLEAAETRRIRVRIYLPFGNGYLPYSLALLKRRPSIAWWLLRDAFGRGQPQLMARRGTKPPPRPSASSGRLG